jgi:hypothetical protein
VGALGHYLEAEGIPTTQISLVREHTEALNPPRALWVPFMLGRPFGLPNNATFQRKVLLAALQLLEQESGPVLEDFPEDAPHDQLTPPPQDLACPVSFPRLKTESPLVERLADEASQLQAWHDVALKHRGRTTLGVTGLSPMGIVSYLTSWLAGNTPTPFRDDLSKGDALKQACDELKAYYYESKAVQPGTHSGQSVQDWFWLETAAGQALQQIRTLAAASEDPTIKAVSAMSIVPRAVDMARQSGSK